MEEITTSIKACPICNSDWLFGYYDGVYYFECEPCDVHFTSYDGKTLLNYMDYELD